MSRPWILGIVSCLILATSTLVGWSQEYLDLPDEPAGQSTSLADKLISLRDKFRRSPSQPAEASATQQSSSRVTARSRPQAPRYRNTYQAQQRARRSSSQQLATQQPSSPAKVSSPQPRTTSSVASSRSRASGGNATIVARPQTSDLLPDTQLFSRSPQVRSSQLRSSGSTGRDEATKTATTLPKLKSLESKAPVQIARRSPSTSRANELEAALADLKGPKMSAPKTAGKVPLANQKAISKPEASLADGALDLRKALLNEKKAVAKQAAKVVEEVKLKAKVVEEATVTKAAIAKAPEPKPSVKPANKPLEVVKKPAPVVAVQPTPSEKPAAPVVVAQTGSKPQQDVAADAPATPPVVIERPSTPQPTINEPIVVSAPKRDVITIATPRVGEPTTASKPRGVAVDPFDSPSNKVVGLRSSSTNPMRPFQPAIEQVKPTESFARPHRAGVLQSTQQPVLVSHVEGPRSILVGREATYQVTLENTSSSAATDIDAQISVPEWAELLDAMSTSGVVERSSEGASAGALKWKISELKPRSSQALRLRLIPRSGRPLQLGVRWSQAPVQSQAVVEVQEPKLELAISGPQEVRFGKAQRYRLTLRNPGTGATEQVVLRLIPPGGDAQSATTQQIGNLKPGEVKDIDLELTAREAGELLIQADAVADGGLTAETTKSVMCLKPELEVDWRGPDRKYAGTVAAYYFRVKNPGTAATEPVDMSVKLPPGTEFVTASEGYSIDASTGLVSWSLASLEAGEEQFMQLRCKIARPGTNDFFLTATTSDEELTDSKAFQTDVVALADLKLEVSDPQGPLPLGEAVVYEIRVRNRGTTGAEHINIVGLFSEGIDPTTVEGAQYSVRDGRVSFHPIKSLPAGREVLLRIHAQASQAGTHIFRTEVTCPKLDIKLAAEETTRFFEDEHRWEQGQTPYMAERESTTQR